MKTFFLLLSAAMLLQAQEPAPDRGPVIRSETREVLVDAVVTDKKGNYLHDLTQKDFKVYEDGKQQEITSFSTEADASNSKRKHYIVLFFDNSHATFGDQVNARAAAKKFLAANAGPNRSIAVVEYTGMLSVAQNFTEDAERLTQAVGGVKLENSTAGPAGSPQLRNGYWGRNVLDALRVLAKGMGSIPERKTLIFLSRGFKTMDPEVMTDLTDAIAACNRANVAVYPIDIGGLTAPNGGPPLGAVSAPRPGIFAGLRERLSSVLASLPAGDGMMASSFQKGGFGGGGGGVRPVAPPAPAPRPTPAPTPAPRTPTPVSPNPGRGGGGGGINQPLYNPNVLNSTRMRTILPPMGSSQDGLYALASGTGGFVIVNSNDLLAGLEKIGREQNQYYLLGYSPKNESEPGSCHSLKVKLNVSGEVRARSGYCDVKPAEVLSGTAAEKDLEAKLGANTPAPEGASMRAAFFYISPNTARVDVAIQIPGDTVTFKKEKGHYNGVLNVLGVAYTESGAVAARFSDAVPLSLADKKQMEEFRGKPYAYEKQFEIASGNYKLKTVFASGRESFGKLEAPMTIEAYSPQQFAMGGIALSRAIFKRDPGALEGGIADDRVPMVANGVELVASGSSRFEKTGPAFLYSEIYEPALLTPAPTTPADPAKAQPDLRKLFGLRMVFTDVKTGQVKLDSGLQRYQADTREGTPMVPVAVRIPVDRLGAGNFQLRVTVMDGYNHASTRTTDFQIE